MKTTEKGIRYVNLMEEETDIDVPLMVKTAKTAYKPFNFKDKIELLIFYNDRKDFSHKIFTEYGIIDDEFDGNKTIHHPFGVKSIIGIEHTSEDTVPLIAFVIGQAIEYFKQNLDIQRHAAWQELEKSEAYQCWQIFFCQVHSARIRYERVGAADLFLRSFPFLLAKKEDSFSNAFIDDTYRHLMNTLSELFVLREMNELDQVDEQLKTYRELTNDRFMEIYLQLFEELSAYMKTLGTKYNEVHELSIFERIQEQKDQFTSALKKSIET